MRFATDRSGRKYLTPHSAVAVLRQRHSCTTQRRKRRCIEVVVSAVHVRQPASNLSCLPHVPELHIAKHTMWLRSSGRCGCCVTEQAQRFMEGGGLHKRDRSALIDCED